MNRPPFIIVLVAAPLLLAAQAASAYVGPGAGITAIGTALALIGALALAVVGFVWYPVKRLAARLRPAQRPVSAPQDE
jgi:hypothetical protein